MFNIYFKYNDGKMDEVLKPPLTPPNILGGGWFGD